MASIEIDTKEYQSLKDENKALFNDIHDLRKRHSALKGTLANTIAFLEDLGDLSLVERTLKWKEISQTIYAFTSEVKNIKENDKGLLD